MEIVSRDGPAISVIIVNYNAGDRLRKCLAHLAEQTFKDFDVIIVDNASADDSIENARGAGAGFRLIEAGGNIGFAAANNLAARQAKGSWLAFLNPDAFAAPDWLEALHAAAKRYDGVDAFGSTQINADNPLLIDGAGDVYHAFGLAYRGGFGQDIDNLPPDGDCFAPCAAAAFVRKQTFLAVGGFHEPFFCYSEDVDFGFRLRLQGGRCIQLKNARVHHEGSGVTGRRSAFTTYHGHRNRVWTYYFNMPLVLLLATLPFHLVLNVLLAGAALAHGQVGAYFRAMWDAHKALPAVLRERTRRQRARTASTAAIARAITWSPLKLLRRSADLRSV